MLESYFKEIQRKKIQKRFFWFLVFLSTLGLFFFFQGKYLSIDFNVKKWDISGWEEGFFSTGSQTGNTTSPITLELFGIINVKTTPKNASILLNTVSHYNNEKIFTKYGKYHLDVSHPGYLSGSMDFYINARKNFYIDTLFLLPLPRYKKLALNPGTHISQIGSNSWIVSDQHTMTLFQDDFLSGKVMNTNGLFPALGEGKFLSGETIVEYNMLDKRWSTQQTRKLKQFLSDCENPQYTESLLQCSNSNNVFTKAEKVLTGVLKIGKNFIQRQDEIIVGDISKNDTKTFPFTGTLAPSPQFLLIDTVWYTNSGGLLKAIHAPNISPIKTKGDDIFFVQKINTTILTLGKKDTENILSIWNEDTPDQTHTLVLPDNLMFEDIRVYEKKGNFFLKTKNALLFFYRESKKVEWLVEGKILAIGDTFCIYEKDDEVWIADWSVPIP